MHLNYRTILIQSLIPTRNGVVTPLLFYINIFVYVVLEMNGAYSAEPLIRSLLAWGAGSRDLVLGGQYWRLLSYLFIHMSLYHLIFNVIGTLIIGGVLESVIGKWRMLFVVLWSGIISAIGIILVESNAVFGGASGSIFGLFGVFVMLMIFRRAKMLSFYSEGILVGVIIWFTLSFFCGFFVEDISNMAHIVGLVTGLALGGVFLLNSFKKRRTFLHFSALSVLLLMAVFLVIKSIPIRFKEYQEALNQITLNEVKAVSIFNENITEAFWESHEFKSIMKTESLPLLNKNLEILENISDNLPELLKTRNELLREYTQLRIEAYTVLINIEGETDYENINKLKKLNKSIDEKLAKVKKTY